MRRAISLLVRSWRCSRREAAAQHGYTQAQVDNGGRLYQASCATCHGAKGDTVRGVALMSGKFSRATSDEELVRIILGGIPGTAMPPNPYTESEAGMIVAYLRSVGSAGGLRHDRRSCSRQSGLRRQGPLPGLSRRRRRRVAHGPVAGRRGGGAHAGRI